ncbi:OmpA family protein [Halocynthiibacter styelae]|uniref:OmpA family protein n=1 Tax=Halocynthiibacter styelae TaxID=2761955 RepID=A0A8J7LPB7_9RHOB|nr:OmpA family protein [Paenihalocynthiibacter styelae]MBI1492602.1 OmpA family protein [Paenihalocynthiibacter styelae]
MKITTSPTRLKSLILVAGLAGLTACAPGANLQFYKEAGSVLNRGNFGNSNMNNHLIQTGQLDYAVNLANRFEAEVPSTINFGFNEATLDAEARRVLTQQANWIRQFPEIQFRVYGHTDLVGGDAYNRRLGLRRAQAVVNFFVAQGISRSRLEAVSSLGESQPLVQTQDRERRNRRTVTGVSGFVQSNPAVLNGKYAQIVWREYLTSAEPARVVERADAEGQGG